MFTIVGAVVVFIAIFCSMAYFNNRYINIIKSGDSNSLPKLTRTAFSKRNVPEDNWIAEFKTNVGWRTNRPLLHALMWGALCALGYIVAIAAATYFPIF